MLLVLSLQGPQRGSGEPGVTSSSSFSSAPGRRRLQYLAGELERVYVRSSRPATRYKDQNSVQKHSSSFVKQCLSSKKGAPVVQPGRLNITLSDYIRFLPVTNGLVIMLEVRVGKRPGVDGLVYTNIPCRRITVSS